MPVPTTTHVLGENLGGRALIVAAALLGGVVTTAKTQEISRPSQVTDAAVTRGREVYFGLASCVACHGESGQGTAEGPSLIDGEWLRGSGTYEEILAQVLHGTPRRESKTGNPMPMRGWIPASDADVRAVAAYV